MNRAQQRAHQTAKGQSKNQLLARAAAAEASTGMFKGFYEEQIRSNERIVIEAEQLVQQAQIEQRATERTIEVMLFQLTSFGDAYPVTQISIDRFNENDEEGEHFVHVEPTDDGFDMTLVFESFEQEDEDEDDTTPDGGTEGLDDDEEPEATTEDLGDSGDDGTVVEEGDSVDAE